MDLLAGINHTALLTPDIDRLAEFYVRLFGASVALDMTEGGLRIVLIDVGRGAHLGHPPSPGAVAHRRGRVGRVRAA